MSKAYTVQKITGLFLKVLKYLIKYQKDPDPSHIHLLRVNIKKIRAIMSFFRNSSTKSNYLPKKVCRKVFDEAGDLRQIQLNLEMLEQHPELVSLVEHVRDQLDKNKFPSKLSKHTKEVIKVMYLLRSGFKLPNEKEIRRYFAEQLQKADNELQQSLNDRSLHKFRMRIKKIMYVHEFLPDYIKIEIPLNTAYIEQLQIQIGLWHDLSAAIEYFEKIKFLPDVFQIIKTKEQNAKDELLRELENFSQKVHILPN